MDDGWLIIYSGILRPYMHIYIYIYSTLCIGYFHSPFCFPRKRRDLRFLLIFLDLRFTTSDNTGTTMGFDTPCLSHQKPFTPLVNIQTAIEHGDLCGFTH